MAIHTSWRFLRGNWRRAAWGIGGVAVLATALGLGRSATLPRAGATEPPSRAADGTLPAVVPQHTADYATRAVANIFDNETLTREEFGEYLIAREHERLTNFVNKRVIEHACRARSIEVTTGEVEAAFAEDLGKLQVNKTEFVDKILKRYNKTLYEWKEDVVRPRLLMTKLVKDQVQVEAKDLQDAYDSYYGEKVDCKIIIWPKEERSRVERDIYAKIRDSEAEFNLAAKSQVTPSLASHEGHLEQPVARHTLGSEELEKVIFALQPGEMSRIVDTPSGVVVAKCIKHIPPNTSVSLESVRETLMKEIVAKKMEQKIPLVFKELKDQAKIQVFIESPTAKEEQLMRMTREETKGVAVQSNQ